MMARKKDESKTERDARICQRFAENPRLSNIELGEEFGLSPARIAGILAAGNMVSRSNRRTPVPYAERKPKSPLLKALGSVLADACGLMEGTKPTIVFGVNEMRLTAMKSGFHPFTVLELERIAKVMGISVSELIRTAEQRGARAAR